MSGSPLYRHLRDFSQGNEAARNAFWEELWRAFHGRLVRFCRCFCPNDAEDIAMEAIEKVAGRATRRAVEYGSRYSSPEHLEACLWLQLRREAQRIIQGLIEKPPIDSVEELDREVPGPGPTPAEEGAWREVYRDYLSALGFQYELLLERHGRARAVGELQEYLMRYVERGGGSEADAESFLEGLDRASFAAFLQQQGRSEDWIEQNLKRRRDLLGRYRVGVEPWLYPRTREEQSCG